MRAPELTAKLARSGADLILDSFDARENWNLLNKWSRKFQKNKALMGDKKFAADVNKFVEGSSFKEIMVIYTKANKLLEAKKDAEAQPVFADAAKRFRGFQKEFPKSKFSPTALFNSTVIYDRAKELDRAITSAERVAGIESQPPIRLSPAAHRCRIEVVIGRVSHERANLSP